MKIGDMARRLDAIAANMTDLQIEGTTRIDWHCLTARERLLFERILEIREEYGRDPPEDVLQEYTHLVTFDNPEEFTCRVAESLEKAKELIEAGFEYVTSMNQKQLFRKRK